MIERLSFEDYQNVKNYAVSILNEYKTRGIEKLETDQVAQIVGDIDSLSNPAKTLLYATLLFPSDEEFINVSNELKDNDKIAEHFGRKVSDVIGKQYQIDIYSQYVNKNDFTSTLSSINNINSKAVSVAECKNLTDEGLLRLESIETLGMAQRRAIEELNSIIEQKNNIIDEHISNIQGLEDDIERLKGINHEWERKAAGLEGQVDNLTSMIIQLTTALRNKEASLAKLEQGLMSYNRDNEEVTLSKMA
ncbi:MAG: hypothetical protein E7172_04425 [Firmicutes bacterium]|nr:hypothetical protein [Bacillota bacterium]